MIPPTVTPGTLVDHSVWKRGKVLAVHPPHVTIYFPALSGSTGGPSRKLQLAAAQLALSKVQSDPALDLISLKKTKGGWKAKRDTVLVKPTLHSVDQAISWFERTYPKLFRDPRLIDMELGYKRDAHDLWTKHFGRGRAENLLARRRLDDVAEGLNALYHATNIPSRFELMAANDGLKDTKAAAHLLRSLLEFMRDPDAGSFDVLVNAVGSLPAPADGSTVLTWPNVTVLPFLAEPRRFIVLKPALSKRMARRMGVDLMYETPPKWHTYTAFLGMSKELLERLAPLGAKDFIDVQSFMWVTKDLE